ncbi:MAG: SDR family NAD(P)-dependent oxidoreductase [Nannocystaceae bacterium]|nr:SDR family NAD(P)-dependent oxidoreductase [Nannocystaceae bacterium]
MKKHYRGKVAVVTGAASGIGRALSSQLAEHGARVWMTDIDVPLLERSAAAIAGDVHTRRLDVTDAEDFAGVLDELWEQEGGVDLLFNNAGIAVIGHYHQMSLKDLNRLIDVNLRGVMHGVQAVYPKMMARRAGHIVNTSSVSGSIAAPGFTMYSATKHAVVGLTRGLRIEAKSHNVKVSCFCPGFIDTELAHNADYRGIDGDKMRAQSPIKFATPESCAAEALRGVAKNEGEIVVTRHAKGMVALQKFAPWILSSLAGQGLRRS